MEQTATERIAVGILTEAETEHPYLTLYVRALVADTSFAAPFGRWQPEGVSWEYEYAAGYIVADAPGQKLAELIYRDGNRRVPQASPVAVPLLGRAVDAVVLQLALALQHYRARRDEYEGTTEADDQLSLGEEVVQYAASLRREYHALAARLQQGDPL